MANPTPITTKKNVPVTLWPDAPDPRTQSGFGAAGLSRALSSIGAGGIVGKRRGNPFGDDNGRGALYASIYDGFNDPAFGGGGCPRSGAPVKLYGNPAWWTKRTMPCTWFIKFTTSTGRTGEFSCSDERYTNRGLLKGTEWKVGDKFITEDGEEEIMELVDVHDPDGKVDFYHATKGHIYSAYGVIGHNKNNPDDFTV